MVKTLLLLLKNRKKNIKLYNKNVEKYGGVKFEDIPASGKSNSDKKISNKKWRNKRNRI